MSFTTQERRISEQRFFSIFRIFSLIIYLNTNFLFPNTIFSNIFYSSSIVLLQRLFLPSQYFKIFSSFYFKSFSYLFSFTIHAYSPFKIIAVFTTCFLTLFFKPTQSLHCTYLLSFTIHFNLYTILTLIFKPSPYLQHAFLTFFFRNFYRYTVLTYSSCLRRRAQRNGYHRKKSVTRVQIPDAAICLSLRSNTSGKYMKPYLPPEQ